MNELTPRQKDLLDYLVKVISTTGVPPTFREIGAALGIGSTNGVSEHIRKLEEKGFIERLGGRGSPRSMRLTEKALPPVDDDTVSIPILGRIAAGNPLAAVEQHDGQLKVDSSLVPLGAHVFALVVTGDSMIEDGIHDGDYLFVRQKAQARDGEIAVAMVDGDATVKRIYREGGRIRLQPANSAMEPIYVDASSGDFAIVGVAVGVYRQL